MSARGVGGACSCGIQSYESREMRFALHRFCGGIPIGVVSGEGRSGEHLLP